MQFSYIYAKSINDKMLCLDYKKPAKIYAATLIEYLLKSSRLVDNRSNQSLAASAQA